MVTQFGHAIMDNDARQPLATLVIAWVSHRLVASDSTYQNSAAARTLKLECPPPAIRCIEKAVVDRWRNAREFVEHRADAVLIES